MIITDVKIKDLKPYEKNAKKHPDDQVEHIANSLKEFGWRQPVVIDKDNVIIIGHGRVLAAKKLKMKTAPCVYADDLSEEQIRALRLADNKTNESSWDFDFLNLELDDITDIDMSQFGFDLGDDEEDPEEHEEEDYEEIEKLDKHYGVPYQGNKSRIADIIISILPEGKRLVDLFGGGGAITHCAMLSGKWESFLYNDLNEMITGLFIDAVYGKYHDEHRVITRLDFNELKDTDAYVKYIWSFGNNGLAYLWGKDIEEIKCQACHALIDETLNERRIAYMHFVKMLRKLDSASLGRLEPVERLQSFEHLQALTQLEALQRLEVSNVDYQQYTYQDGDIVYCDVPYEQTGKGSCDDYGVSFDSKAFYEWAHSRPFQVFFSSYEISDDTFYSKKIKSVMSLIGATTNGQKRTEYLYSNMPFSEE